MYCCLRNDRFDHSTLTAMMEMARTILNYKESIGRTVVSTAFEDSSDISQNDAP